MAEYRYADGDGEKIIVQPRVLAQTAVIERHVIRSEIPGTVIHSVVIEPMRSPRVGSSTTSSIEAAEHSGAWSAFVERFAEGVPFDDPGQPPPRRGGNG